MREQRKTGKRTRSGGLARKLALCLALTTLCTSTPCLPVGAEEARLPAATVPQASGAARGTGEGMGTRLVQARPHTEAPETDEAVRTEANKRASKKEKKNKKAPTKAPKKKATASPTKAPKKKATAAPTKAPKKKATASPTKAPKKKATASPTKAPKKKATAAPTKAPKKKATAAPTKAPKKKATAAPTKAPKKKAKQVPAEASKEKSGNKSKKAVKEKTAEEPTEIPTKASTEAPTEEPTEAPTEAPTEEPTEAPTEAPTEEPTEAPTEAPTEEPTEAPTEAPTEEPTEAPTEAPTEEPTEAPTEAPTEEPTEAPTEAPTEEPTEAPTPKPVEDGVYAAAVKAEDGGKLYITAKRGKIKEMRVLAEDADAQARWNEWLDTLDHVFIGIAATTEAVEGVKLETYRLDREAERVAAALQKAAAEALDGEKLSSKAEREYRNRLKEATAEIPTEEPTEELTEEPTQEPTEVPTEEPTEAPTEEPTEAPTEQPTEAPSEEPTEEPTEAPTEQPTEAPTEEPTEAPTEAPTEEPTAAPTQAPGGPRRVRGAQVAADGTYTATVTATKTKDSSKSYTGTVYVVVADGKFSHIYIVASKKQDRFSDMASSISASLVGNAATAAQVDAVSSASLSGSSSSSKYTSNLTDAIKTALAAAAERVSDSGDAAQGVEDGVYTGTGSMSAYESGNSHYITVDVTVKDGKIVAIAINTADGSWDSLLESVSGSYVGGAANTDTVDAVTTATSKHYREAIRDAIDDALGKAPTGGGSSGGGSGTETPEPDPLQGDTLTLKVGDSYALTGRSEDGAGYSYSWTVSDPAKVSLSANEGYSVTVTGLAVTDSPVTVACDWSFMGFMTGTTTYKVVVADDGTTQDDPSGTVIIDADDPDFQKKLSGQTYEGDVIVRSYTEVKFENCVFKGRVIVEDSAEAKLEGCTFYKGVEPRDSSAEVKLENGTFVLADGVGFTVASNELAEVYTDTVLTEDDGVRLSYPQSLGGKALSNQSLVVRPDWASGALVAGDGGYNTYAIIGTTPSEKTTETFAVHLEYGDLGVTVPLRLKVKEREYTVAFETNGGEPAPEPQNVKKNRTAQRPETAPEKEGFDFDGWYADEALTQVYDFEAPVTGDITLYAQWTAQIHTVSFDADGGEPAPEAQAVAHGQAATEPETAPEKEGFDFDGWYADEALTQLYDFEAPVTGDITLYAQWTAQIHTVSFDADGGEPAPEAQAVAHGQAATEPEPAPEKEGFDFDGWYADETLTQLYDFEAPVTGDLILYAGWVEGERALLTVVNSVPGLPETGPFAFTVSFGDGQEGGEPLAPEGSGPVRAEAGQTWAFELKGGERLSFDIPAGTPYRVVSRDRPGYDAGGASLSLAGGDTPESDATRTENALTLASVAAAGENTAVFTRSVPPMTGVADDITPFIFLMALALLGLAACTGMRRYKATNQNRR